MKLTIVGNILAVCRINMSQFKVDLCNDLDLKGSLKKNFEIVDVGKFNEEVLFQSIYLGLDWGKIIDLINDIDKEFMEIRFFQVNYENKIEFTPNLVSEDCRIFIFNQIVKSGVDVIMINSFTNSPDYDISSYLHNIFNFGDIRWKPLINK